MLRNEPAPVVAPLVISPACLVDPVTENPVEEPPMPAAIERPAGQPSAANWDRWLTYEARRRERAELAGLYYQGERDSIRSALTINVEQMRQCQAWAKAKDEEQRR